MEKLYAIIPAYNEQDNIRKVINDWYDIIVSTGEESRLVVINDGSTDGTFAIMQEEAVQKPALVVLSKENSGHGATVLFGYRYALDNGADYVFQTDSDGQTLPSEFDMFYKRRHEYPFIIGRRSGRKDGLFRIITTRVLQYAVRVVFGVSLKDINTPYRLMSRELLEDCLRFIPEGFNLSNVVLTVAAARRRYRGLFIPITFRKRQGGKNSINLRKIIKIGIAAVRDFREINKKLPD